MSLTAWNRVVYSDNGVLTDYTLAAQNSDVIPLELVAAEDWVYMGQHFPFNSFFFDVNTANSNASAVEVQVWDGEQFVPAVDILDETSVSGVSLSRSGTIIFAPDRDEDWNRTLDTEDTDAPPALSGLRIYNLYWMRFRFSADLSAGTAINKIGYRFATSEQLYAIDPDLDQYLNSWDSGKQNWDEQLQKASERVASDLKNRGIILHRGQILRLDEVSQATVHAALRLIYTPLGPDFEFRLNEAKAQYDMLIQNGRFTLDWDRDGTEDSAEVKNSPVGMAVR
jgi:hypothetical protein